MDLVNAVTGRDDRSDRAFWTSSKTLFTRVRKFLYT